MGTDIHGEFQRHDPTTDAWVDIPHNYGMDRHYQLFAVLAGVRNGTGFAGVKTGEPVKPIAEPRGLPEDFEVVEDEHGGSWMGDHSHSWLTADEMLAWYENAPIVVHTGILDRAVYESWDHKGPPSIYCCGISGPSVVVIIDNAVMRANIPEWTHIRCEWDVGLKQELAYFFEEVARLKTEHGTVRFVFGS